MEVADIKYLNKYLAYKIRKIKWNNCSLQTFEIPSIIATGSWDENTNTLDLWSLLPNRNNILSISDDNEEEIIHMGEVNLGGDVTGIEFVKDNFLLASTSRGNLNLIKYDLNDKKLEIMYKWANLHTNDDSLCSCTSFASFGKQGDFCVVTVGEDERLNVITEVMAMKNSKIQRSNFDSTTINDVKFLNENNICTANSIGQVKICDRRLDIHVPQLIFNITSDHDDLYNMDIHPTRTYMLACGGYDGNLYIVDTRMAKTPAARYIGHSFDLMQVKFDESYPNNIFTCSGDSSVFHWRCNDSSLSIGQQSQVETSKQGFGEPKFEIENLMSGNRMPMNSLDVHSNRLVCGGDGGLLTYINSLSIH